MDTVNCYYAARSNLVHGATLKGAKKESFRELLSNREPILDIARRLLLGFLRMIDGQPDYPSISVFKEKLDAILVHAVNREALRSKMGLRQGQ